MYHNLLTTTNHPQHAELEKAIQLVLAFSDIASVYFSPHLEEGLDSGIVLFIIDNDSPHAWDEFYDHCWKVFEAFPISPSGFSVRNGYKTKLKTAIRSLPCIARKTA